MASKNTAEAEKDLIKNLVNLVNAAKKVPTNGNKDITETLRNLYPSTSRKQEEHQRQFQNKSPLTPAQVWGGGDNNVGKRKSNTFLKRKAVSKKTKITETLKDIIFINDPDVCDVPRKSDRAFYYRGGLVALAVKFSSDMDDFLIRETIKENFTGATDIDFEYMKAVEDSLVCPLIQDWDYKTMKHVCGQGPIYVRSLQYFSPPNKVDESEKNEKRISYFTSEDEDDVFDNVTTRDHLNLLKQK